MCTLCHPDYLLIHSKGSMLGPGNHIKYALAAQGQKFLLIAWVASIFPKSTKGQKQHNSEASLHRILVCILHVYCQSPNPPNPPTEAGWLAGALWHLLSHPHTDTHTPGSWGWLSCKSAAVRRRWWKHCFTVDKSGPGVLVRTAICSHFAGRTSPKNSKHYKSSCSSHSK